MNRLGVINHLYHFYLQALSLLYFSSFLTLYDLSLGSVCLSYALRCTSAHHVHPATCILHPAARNKPVIFVYLNTGTPQRWFYCDQLRLKHGLPLRK